MNKIMKLTFLSLTKKQKTYNFLYNQLKSKTKKNEKNNEINFF